VRTATHAFNLRSSDTYKKYTWNNPDKNYRGGFGRQILGETWVSHYGNHGRQSTRGLVAKGMQDHPIVRGVDDVWGPTDVYGITTLHGDAKPVLMGQVLEGMKPTDRPAKGKKLVPVAWIKTYTAEGGKTGRVFTTTMGASQDFLSEGLRRLFVNACYWALGMEKQIPAKADVSLVGAYKPTPFGFGKHKKGVKPSDLELK
jgi:type 1 glutamine amidotransferase